MQRKTNRRGAAIIYVSIIMVALMAVVSLAVDLSRYEVAHSQLANAALSAARAGAASMPYGSSATSATALATATSNVVDGQYISSGNVTITYLNWVSKGNYTVVSAGNFAQANAVRVAISYSVPLAFAKVIGLSSKPAVEESTAMLATQIATPYVYATGNPWLAGMPAGTTASQPDPGYGGLNVNTDHRYQYDIAGTPGMGVNGSNQTYNGTSEPTSSPVQVAINVTPGSIILVTSATGSVSWDAMTSPDSTPNANGGTTGNDRNHAANSIAEHGIADTSMPLGSLVGVFLTKNQPDTQTPPPSTDFSTQAARDYTGIQPKNQQPFYMGNGQTSGGQQQQILVPPNATRLFLGIMDGWEWSNNNGGFNVTVMQATITTVE